MAQLTTQQFRVLGMLLRGTNPTHSSPTNCSLRKRPQRHMTVILRELGAANRTQAVVLAGRLVRGSSDIKPLPDGIE